MTDKRRLNADTRNFKPTDISVEDGVIMFAFTRKDDGRGGMEYIGADGYDKTRNKSIVPDKAFFKLDLPKGYKIVNENSFRPTELMYTYVAQLFKCGGKEQEAVDQSGIAPTSLAKWKKKEGFLEWQTAQIQELSKSLQPRLLASAYKKAENDPNMMKYLLDKGWVREEQTEVAKTNIIDFSGNWKNMCEEYNLVKEDSV